jgi:membrane protease subunit HflC
MGAKGVVGLAGALIVVLVVLSSVYIIPETHRGVLLRFGELIETDIQAGLHFKVPVIDQVREFDVRLLTTDLPSRQYLTVEKKPLDVDSYIAWKIRDVDQFYRATGGDEFRASSLLLSRVDNGLRDEFGVRTMVEVVSGQRDALMNELTAELNTYVADEYGIEVIDVRVKRIDLPDDVRSSVYERMTSERQREAQQLRSRGNELAIGIEADADRQEAVLLVEAYRDSERIRGDGDTQAAAIYSAAYTQDPEFYSFTRSLNSYRDTFSSKSDVMLLDPESDYFKYLRSDEIR